MSATQYVTISGVGVEIPARVVTTAEIERQARLSERFDLAPGWLEETTGVHERRFAASSDSPGDLAAHAGRAALADAGVDAADVDVVIFAGITRDCLEPATANLVAEKIGAHHARAFDLVNACNGVVDGIDVAESMVRSGKAERVLVATGERASISINWQPASFEELLRSVAGLVVGDGGGAVVVEASDDAERGLRERVFRTDSRQWALASGGHFRWPSPPCAACGSIIDPRFLCDGSALFGAAMRLLRPAMDEVLQRTGWALEDLAVTFCHQPTLRFVEHAARVLGRADDTPWKLWRTADRFGNVSTVSLPLAMVEAKRAGALFPRAKVLILAPSSGVSVAAITLVW